MSNNATLNHNINAIRRRMSDAEIRRTFAQRFDDEMFAVLGKFSFGKIEARKKSQSELVWEGYEKLLGIEKI